MKVRIEIERSLTVEAPLARTRLLLKDLETTIRRFPKLRKLTKLKDSSYLWEMSPIGSKIARISHEVSYAADYSINAERTELSWKPVPKHGNATIEGRFRLQESGNHTLLSFEVRGELRDVPVPLTFRLVAPPFIQGRFTYLVDSFLERTAEAVTGRA